MDASTRDPAAHGKVPSEAFLNGYGHGNDHDKVMDFPCSYTSEEKFSYWKGFQAGRDVWIAGKPARAWADRHKAKRGGGRSR